MACDTLLPRMLTPFKIAFVSYFHAQGLSKIAILAVRAYEAGSERYYGDLFAGVGCFSRTPNDNSYPLHSLCSASNQRQFSSPASASSGIWCRRSRGIACTIESSEQYRPAIATSLAGARRETSEKSAAIKSCLNPKLCFGWGICAIVDIRRSRSELNEMFLRYGMEEASAHPAGCDCLLV
jgi:hypothetical protein